MTNSWKNIQAIVGLAAFFVVIAIAAGITKAALATASLVVAYLLEFYVLRLAVRYFLSRKVDIASVIIGAAAIAGGVLLVYMEFGTVLAMAIVSIFLLDALILRFSGLR